MTKRRSTKSNKQSTAGAILGAIVLFVLLIISRLTGIDLLGPGIDATTVPTAVVGTPIANVPPGNVTAITIPQGFGAQKSFWQVYFTAPTGSSDRSRYTGGIDTALAAAIGATTRTLDIAAYEFNNPVLTQAVLDARRRGVQVRVVTDDEDGLGDAETTLNQFQSARISVVSDDRGALMHNKFMILDSTTVWMGSWNYTINDTYRNNNNALVLRSRQAVQNYQQEFDEMFAQGQFGPRSPGNTPNPQFTQDGVTIQTMFSPEDEVVDTIITAIRGANRNVRFMTFSFTVDEIGQALIAESRGGVQVQGIFETTGSETEFSEMRPLRCAGLDVRQDGNPYILHHKVFIIDDTTVVTGSFNISANATDSNDENLVVVQDRDLAAQYLAEFQRRWAEAAAPGNISC